jgi:hypothetical protein
MPPRYFRDWFNLLCIANEQKERGVLPTDIGDIAFDLNTTRRIASQSVSYLLERGLLDKREDGALVIHNWGGRQFQSTSSTGRVQQWRKRLDGVDNSGYLDKGARERIFQRDNNTCVYCGKTDNLVLDHMVPVLLGGDGLEDTLAVACRQCNSGKSGRTPEGANYTFASQDARNRYKAAMERLHETPRNPHQITETETETETETPTPLPPAPRVGTQRWKLSEAWIATMVKKHNALSEEQVREVIALALDNRNTLKNYPNPERHIDVQWLRRRSDERRNSSDHHQGNTRTTPSRPPRPGEPAYYEGQTSGVQGGNVLD